MTGYTWHATAPGLEVALAGQDTPNSVEPGPTGGGLTSAGDTVGGIANDANNGVNKTLNPLAQLAMGVGLVLFLFTAVGGNANGSLLWYYLKWPLAVIFIAGGGGEWLVNLVAGIGGSFA